MTLVIRHTLLPLPVLLIAALSAVAGDHHREHPIPGLANGCLVYVRPGEQVKITVSFEAANENCVQIYEHGTGRLLQVWNNYDGGGGSWLSPKNTGDAVHVLLVVGRHKDSPPNGKKPWRLSYFKILDQTDTAVVVGWEDADDQDYNDAVAVIQIVR